MARKRKQSDTIPIDSVDIEVVLDRSGSMFSIAQDAAGGYNTWLASQQALPGEATLTLTLFDHELLTQPMVALRDAKPLDNRSYIPRGMTALYDAIGAAITRLRFRNPAKAILVILTDGYENKSTEYDATTVRAMIEDAQKRGWQVVYLSADARAFSHAKGIGVLRANTAQFTRSAAGVQAAYATATALNCNYRGS